jgi:hypothetical protein
VATDTYGQGVQIPALTDAPNISLVGQSMDDIIAKSNMSFASATDRNATLTDPVAGMVAFLDDSKIFTGYDGSTWQTIVASTLPWANVVLPSGYQAWIGNTVGPRVRREGSIVYLEGRMMRTDSTNIAAQDGLTIGTVPLAYQPVGHYAEGHVSLSNAGTGAPVGRIEIWHRESTDGPGTIRLWTDKPSQWIGFSSWWFVN